MDLHPSVKKVVSQLYSAELHAARSGREVMHALGDVVADSRSLELANLVEELEASTVQILKVLPAYAPPLNTLLRFFACLERGIASNDTLTKLKARFAEELYEYNRWTQTAPERLSQFAAQMIQPGMKVYTHTLSETAMRSLNTAIASGVPFQVFVSESQPNCDGVITAQQLARSGVKVTLGLDAAIGELVSKADLMLTGAEAITPQGSAICKVGTYLAALVACEYGVPYYVLADTHKFVPSPMMSFFASPESFNQPDLFLNKKVDGIQFCEQLFDTTPSQFITGIVTEKGVISPLACGYILQDIPSSERVIHLIKCARAVNPAK